METSKNISSGPQLVRGNVVVNTNRHSSQNAVYANQRYILNQNSQAPRLITTSMTPASQQQSGTKSTTNFIQNLFTNSNVSDHSRVVVQPIPSLTLLTERDRPVQAGNVTLVQQIQQRPSTTQQMANVLSTVKTYSKPSQPPLIVRSVPPSLGRAPLILKAQAVRPITLQSTGALRPHIIRTSVPSNSTLSYAVAGNEQAGKTLLIRPTAPSQHQKFYIVQQASTQPPRLQAILPKINKNSEKKNEKPVASPLMEVNADNEKKKQESNVIFGEARNSNEKEKDVKKTSETSSTVGSDIANRFNLSSDISITVSKTPEKQSPADCIVTETIDLTEEEKTSLLCDEKIDISPNKSEENVPVVSKPVAMGKSMSARCSKRSKTMVGDFELIVTKKKPEFQDENQSSNSLPANQKLSELEIVDSDSGSEVNVKRQRLLSCDARNVDENVIRASIKRKSPDDTQPNKRSLLKSSNSDSILKRTLCKRNDEKLEKMESENVKPRPASSKSARRKNNSTVRMNSETPPPTGKSKDDKKADKLGNGEIERDSCDVILDYPFKDGIAELPYMGLHFGLSEFGQAELISREEVERSIKTSKKQEAQKISGKRFDNGKTYTCKKCDKPGSVKSFFSPEFCTQKCYEEKRQEMGESCDPGEEVQRNNVEEAERILKVFVNVKQAEQKENPLREEPEEADLEMQAEDYDDQIEVKCIIQEEEDEEQSSGLEASFSWEDYLGNTTLVAPQNLFSSPMPKEPNPFQVNMALEVIDPEYQSLYCVATVVKVLGFRMKIHFDGYSSIYDFWVNADSPDIFPPGYCQRTSRDLQPPPQFVDGFDWSLYLDTSGKVAAPSKIFPHMKRQEKSGNFRQGMKLEVNDRNRGGNLFIATVSDCENDRILVHFDSFDDRFDVWLKVDSPYLHPRDYHYMSAHNFVAPQGFEDLMVNGCFDWDAYLQEVGGTAAPANLFKLRKPKAFKRGMKFEMIDRANPEILRPASIIDCRGYELEICYDGFQTKYAYIITDDCPDMHAIKYSVNTNHPIVPPANKSHVNNLCCIPGCGGLGNFVNDSMSVHRSVDQCPYSLENWKSLDIKKKMRPMRLNLEDVVKRNDTFQREVKIPKKSDDICTVIVIDDDDSQPGSTESKQKKIKKQKNSVKTNENRYCRDQVLDSLLPKVKTSFVQEEFVQMKTVFNAFGNITKCPLDWSVQEVEHRVEKMFGQKVAKRFVEHDIDGKCFLALSKDDLLKQMKFSLGVSIKLFNAISAHRADVLERFTNYKTKFGNLETSI